MEKKNSASEEEGNVGLSGYIGGGSCGRLDLNRWMSYFERGRNQARK
jgi:hypothetical protein